MLSSRSEHFASRWSASSCAASSVDAFWALRMSLGWDVWMRSFPSFRFPLFGQSIYFGSDPAERLVIIGTQVIQTVLVTKLMDEQPHDLFRDPLLEPVST